MTGHVIAITGGSGFFGHAFVRTMIARQDVESIRVFSRDEFKQHRMRATFQSDKVRYLVGDVRDRDRLRRAFEGVDLVVHAAALKRVEVGEYNPSEMVRTNVTGSLNVIEAAMDARVADVIALSTDKACEPANCYGATKLTMEKLFIGANATRGKSGPRFAVTRYGNVAGSTGSVIPTWHRILSQNPQNPIVMTDPWATRFWMTAAEAVALVCWTWDHMEGGELLVPELKAYAVQDLADAMGAERRMTVGLTPGEKLHEQMMSDRECHRFSICPTASPFYWITPPRGLGIASGMLHPQGMKSDNAPRMSVEELRTALGEIGYGQGQRNQVPRL